MEGFQIDVRVGKRMFNRFETAVQFIDRELHLIWDVRSTPDLIKSMRETLNKINIEVRAQNSQSWNGSVFNPSDKLQRRSGKGLRSILDSIRVLPAFRLNDLDGRIGTGLMTIHETGGTITAKRAKFLTIPLPAAMDAQGVPLKRRARDWDNTFVARSRAGNLIIFQRRTGGRITPLYLLKRSIKIRPRLGLAESVGNNLPFFERKVLDAVDRQLDISFRGS